MEFYPFTNKWGNTDMLGFARGEYYDGNCYVSAYVKDEQGGYVEPYADVTVNLEPFESGYRAAIDTNNFGPEIKEFLVDNGFAIDMMSEISSGFCSYPIVEFVPEWLDSLDSVG